MYTPVNPSFTNKMGFNGGQNYIGIFLWCFLSQWSRGCGFNCCWVLVCGGWLWNIFYSHSLPLIWGGQLSVSGVKCAQVNCLEYETFPGKLCLSKLTTLYITLMGWLGCKTWTQSISSSFSAKTVKLYYCCLCCCDWYLEGIIVSLKVLCEVISLAAVKNFYFQSHYWVNSYFLDSTSLVNC